MAGSILTLLKKSTLSFFGITPKIADLQQSKLEKQFAKQSKLDLDGKTPPKYEDIQKR